MGDISSHFDPFKPHSGCYTIAVGEGVPSEQLGKDPADAELLVEGEVGEVQGQSPGNEERPKSSIAKTVQTRPRP